MSAGGGRINVSFLLLDAVLTSDSGRRPGLGDVLICGGWLAGFQAPGQFQDRGQAFTDQNVTTDFPLYPIANIDLQLPSDILRQGYLKLGPHG